MPGAKSSAEWRGIRTYEVLFYKGEIHEQVLIDERVRINRKVTNVFMGVFCGVFAVMYLICRAEEKSRRDVIVVDARRD